MTRAERILEFEKSNFNLDSVWIFQEDSEKLDALPGWGEKPEPEFTDSMAGAFGQSMSLSLMPSQDSSSVEPLSDSYLLREYLDDIPDIEPPSLVRSETVDMLMQLDDSDSERPTKAKRKLSNSQLRRQYIDDIPDIDLSSPVGSEVVDMLMYLGNSDSQRLAEVNKKLLEAQLGREPNVTVHSENIHESQIPGPSCLNNSQMNESITDFEVETVFEMVRSENESGQVETSLESRRTGDVEDILDSDDEESPEYPVFPLQSQVFPCENLQHHPSPSHTNKGMFRVAQMNIELFTRKLQKQQIKRKQNLILKKQRCAANEILVDKTSLVDLSSTEEHSVDRRKAYLQQINSTPPQAESDVLATNLPSGSFATTAVTLSTIAPPLSSSLPSISPLRSQSPPPRKAMKLCEPACESTSATSASPLLRSHPVATTTPASATKLSSLTTLGHVNKSEISKSIKSSPSWLAMVKRAFSTPIDLTEPCFCQSQRQKTNIDSMSLSLW